MQESHRNAVRVVELEGAVQHYEWGGFDFIPALLGHSNEKREPYAELWIGAHPKAPSLARVDGARIPLDRLIEGAAEEVLGRPAARFERRLPYLFKVLDARKMLSIQAHPSKAQAEEGFARENAAGIPPDAPSRNYKDNNHKPEAHVALTDFRMLHGFRPLEEIAETLNCVPELAPLMPDFGSRLTYTGSDPDARRALLKSLYRRAMEMPQEEAGRLLNPLLARLERENSPDKDSPDFWAVRAASDFPLPGGYRDKGIFSIYLLNLVRLAPGQGTFQPAGTLHAYLEGVNVELMANSDNVLRGGLTAKHVDADELLRTLRFESGKPEILEGVSLSDTERAYPTAAQEFLLSRITLAAGQTHTRPPEHGPDALVLLQGSALLRSGNGVIPMKGGTIVFAPHPAGYTLEAQTPEAVLYRAAVP
ncbi:MAG: mannose-6-phosphate isomerase, class I [Armatimonadetes bacterium]|nr:mannose-6-phosphate isomerase, class I [Armatimonadota bacterium]